MQFIIDNKTLSEIIGGIFIILYGIHLSSVNLQKILGSYLEETLKKAKNNPWKGFVIGAAVTGIIHSSETTSMVLIGLITGNFMGFAETVPVMLGAKVGSTIVTQFASLQIGGFAFLILALGVLIHMSATKKLTKQIGEALVGFSFIFFGAQFLFTGVNEASHQKIFVDIIHAFTISPLSSIVTGAFATAIPQSTSIASILTVALGISGIINLPVALFLILGINLGSSLKVVYTALKGRNFSGRLTLIHLFSNLLGLFVFLIFFEYFQDIIRMTSADPGRQIANAHTFYNIVSALIFIPLVPAAIDFVEKLTPSSKPLKKARLFYLDRKLICTPSVSLNQANRGTVEMAKISYEMLEMSRVMFFEGKTELLADIKHLESKIDDMTEKISEYTIQVSQQNLNRENKMKLYSLMHIVADIEHLCDHILAVAEIFTEIKNDENIVFSEKAQSELVAVYGKLKIMQNLVIKSLKENNVKLANEISLHENKVDEIIKKITANNQKRLDEEKCTPEASKYFSDILYNLERIGDHYDNIAYAIIDRVRQEERS